MRDKYWFVDVAEKLHLSIGASHYVAHPGCTARRTAWLYRNKDGVGFYCNRCQGQGFKYDGKKTIRERLELERLEAAVRAQTENTVRLPDDATHELPDQALNWFRKAGIGSHRVASLRAAWSDTYERVFLPFFDRNDTLIYYQARSIDGREPKYLNPTVDKERILYRPPYQDVRDFSLCAVTEDALSTVRCAEHTTSYSISGTKISDWQRDVLARFKIVALWLDGDRAGVLGRNKILKKFKWTCSKVHFIHTEEDPKYYADYEVGNILHAAIDGYVSLDKSRKILENTDENVRNNG